MKAVMISIRPEWCAKIANGQKTIEVRKTRPNLKPPFKCYIYCTSSRPYLVLGEVFYGNWETEYITTYGYSREKADRIWDVMNRKVIGEFVCDRVSIYRWNQYDVPFQDSGEYNLSLDELRSSCLTHHDLEKYGFDGLDFCTLYGWHIADLKIYDEYDGLLEVSQFIKPCPNNEVCESCAMYSEFEDRCGNAAIQVHRPPQSWYYVEDGFFGKESIK